ncbi:hypothetical protein MXM82_24225 [Pseudomonas asiatica]|uniref:hypothetical protein n=1 Tax=Pseudomonas asiatica TaxID=2219225 RepID=UPI002DB877AF|nr:hypothetical protein [Pseudomonas asiatica]MEB6592207.1 hypothetical protein [Pseudomonas asiatica]
MPEDELVSRGHPVQEDMPMQQRVWRFERIGWYVLVVIVLLALAGLFGNGPLSDAEVVSQDGRVKVEYQRLSRSGTTDNLFITVQGTPGQPVMVELEGTLLRQASIETLQPEPQASMSHGPALLLQLGTSKDGMATLYLTLRSEHVGTLEGVVRAGSNSAVHFSTFLYP